MGDYHNKTSRLMLVECINQQRGRLTYYHYKIWTISQDVYIKLLNNNLFMDMYMIRHRSMEDSI